MRKYRTKIVERQGLTVSPDLFNLYTDVNLREWVILPGFIFAKRNFNTRYEYDNVLMTGREITSARQVSKGEQEVRSNDQLKEGRRYRLCEEWEHR